MDVALIGFGLGVAILEGMTGIGGGSLMTPMLILVFGVTPVTAVGTLVPFPLGVVILMIVTMVRESRAKAAAATEAMRQRAQAPRRPAEELTP